MTTRPMIVVDRVTKEYRIGERTAAYGTLRDAGTRMMRRAFHRLQSSRPEGRQLLEALNEVSFEVHAGETVGVIGRNGAGKSTLLKLLGRITQPTRGSIDLYGRVGCLLEVGTGFHAELSGRENVYLSGAILGMRRADIQRRDRRGKVAQLAGQHDCDPTDLTSRRRNRRRTGLLGLISQACRCLAQG